MSRNLPCGRFLFAVILLTLLALSGCSRADVATGDGVAPTVQAESPLVEQENNQQIVVYEGASVGPYPDHVRGPTYRLEFDYETWWHGAGEPFGSALVHRRLPSCILALHGDGSSATQRNEIRIASLAGREWSVLQQSADYARGSVTYVSPPFGFRVIFSGSPENTLPDEQVMCIQDAEQVINTFAIAPDARQTIASDPPPKLRIWFKASEDAQGEPRINSMENTSTWPGYTSVTGGYSFNYPPGWTVSEWEKGYITLSNPLGVKSDTIYFSYLNFEKPEKESLIPWLELYFASWGPASSRSFTPVALTAIAHAQPLQQIQAKQSAPFIGDEYLISHGNLVLQVSTFSAWITQPQLLLEIVNTLEFSADAPTNMTELYSPEEPPLYTDLESWLHQP